MNAGETAEVQKTITELRVSDIVIGDRLRPVSDAGVVAIIASIEELGVMKDPIHVRKVKHRGGEYVLLAGAHRLASAQRLGWETIKVTCWTCNDDFARLMEIDDNLAGAELTALDTAVFLAERKRLYEKLHPEAKRGAAGANARWDATEQSSVAFSTATAEKFGLSARQVRKIVAAGDCLAPDEVRKLRSAPRAVSLKDLQEIGKIGQPAERYHVVETLAAGGAKNAAKARKLWKAEQGLAPEPPRPAEQEYMRLLDSWDRSRKSSRKLFLGERLDEVRALLAEIGDGDDLEGVESDD
ncbi:chromosome partitioning protein ParB [Alloyangia pacifica]|uniref:Chromosome partitioning protein ParB n=1 Tax=Alloyangia pacifica TaxID=311180 RepID=A0A2U8HBN0_9RHOB|nr:ParB N-terminal domain-containing protein [Alloyangia pacifica]AWI83040.1 chromosome partitioning protein ParB [Alloyangia pacifica]